MVKLHRMSQRLMEAVGQSSKVTKDARFDGASKTHSQMMKDLDTLGAGLSEHLTMSHKFYKNTTTLLEVTAARCDAAVAPVGASTRLAWERWSYVHSTVRRSMNKIIVDGALDPLRVLTSSTTCRDACADRTKRRLDLDAAQRAADAGKGEATALHRSRFGESDEVAKRELLRSKVVREAVLEHVGVAVLAAQAELLSTTAEYAVDAASAFPPDRVSFFRNAIRKHVDTGGPPLVEANGSGAAKLLAVVTGKKTPVDLRLEKEALQKRKHQRAEALASNYVDAERSSEFVMDDGHSMRPAPA